MSAVANGTSPSTITFARTLRLGSSGADVSALQSFLIQQGVYPAAIVSGYFGRLTQQAVIQFQEKYQTEILAPYGLTVGTGIVGPATRAELNKLLQ